MLSVSSLRGLCQALLTEDILHTHWKSREQEAQNLKIVTSVSQLQELPGLALPWLKKVTLIKLCLLFKPSLVKWMGWTKTPTKFPNAKAL